MATRKLAREQEEQELAEAKRQTARERNRQHRLEARVFWRDAGLIEERDMPVSRATLWRWRRAEPPKISPVRFGDRRIFYRRSEVERLLAPEQDNSDA
jgi:hypothetical protein